MDYCLNLNSSTKLKQSTRTTKQNRHFYFTNPHTLFIKLPPIFPTNQTCYSAIFHLVWTRVGFEKLRMGNFGADFSLLLLIMVIFAEELCATDDGRRLIKERRQ